MNIDIISYSDAQYARMTETQLLEVREAQLQKDRLTDQLEEDKRKQKYRLLKNGVFRSCLYEQICETLDRRYIVEVERIRDRILFYLRFVMKPEEEGESAPYEVDYSLEYVDRFDIVKAYYLEAYTDPKERLEAYWADSVAKDYLGEYYMTLYDYLKVQ